MRNLAVAAIAVACLGLTTSGEAAAQSGDSNTWQLSFDDASGKAHVKAPELEGEVHIVVNLKGLDPEIEYVVKSQGQVVGQGFPNKGGNLNLQGAITDEQGSGKVNLRLVSDDSLVAATEEYEVGANPSEE